MRTGNIACVLGTIELVRALGLGGIRCAVVARHDDPGRFSRFTIDAVDWLDPAVHAERLVERLLEFAATQPEPPVLYYEGDADLLLVSRFRDRLRTAFRFVIADSELVESLVHKWRFQRLAEKLELPVPRARLIRSMGGEVDDLDLRFPVVVKPIMRETETWRPFAAAGLAKAVLVQTPRDLRTLRPLLAEAGIDVLTQELVVGPESQVESYHAYIHESGELVAEFTGRKIRTRPATFGYSTALVITEQQDVADIGRKILRRLGLRGVAKVDLKRAEDGTLWLLEVNPRFNLWHHPAALAGVNVPRLVYRDVLGLPRTRPSPPRAGVRWCWPDQDIRAAREAGIPLRTWFRWMLTCEARSAFAPTDPMPFVRGVIWGGISRRLRSRAGHDEKRHRSRRPARRRTIG